MSVINKYPISVKYLTSATYNKTTPFSATGGVIHNTASPGDTDEAEYKYFEGGAGGRQASAHIFLDWDSITQCVPWDRMAWHAGYHANHAYWGVEMCTTSDPAKFKEIWDRATWLYAYLFSQVANPRILKVTTDNLHSHREISAMYPADTDHVDPEGYIAQFGKTIPMFRADVQKYIDLMVAEGVAKVEVTAFKGKVTVTADFLNIRSAPITGGVLSSVPNGTVLVATGVTADGWYRVNYDGGEGYCSGKYLTVVEDAPAVVTPVTPKPADPYTDWADVSTWAKDAVLKCKELGIMVGGDGAFTPKGNLTREQAAVLVTNILKYLGKI